MRFLLVMATVLTLVSAQEAPEGYVSKEAIEKLFKATQGGEVFIGELPPLFVGQGITAPEGFEILGGTQQDFSMGVGSPQMQIQVYFDASGNSSLEGFKSVLAGNTSPAHKLRE